MSAYTNIILFYLNTFITFLNSEPIIYFVGAIFSLFVLKILKSLLRY